jgi:hypothetical protein
MSENIYMDYRHPLENDFSFEETTAYGHFRDQPSIVPDDWRQEIDQETGCTGAEMHAMDCTVDEILWYENAKYRERTLRRFRPDLADRVEAAARAGEDDRRTNRIDPGIAGPLSQEEVA